MHLHLTESSAVPGMQITAEAERTYWLNREQAAVKAPAEIDVHAFHDALGLMYPMNWRSSENGECETFMLAEMICGNVTEIYARIGIRYYRMRDYSNLDHAEILARVKEVSDKSQNEKAGISLLIPRRMTHPQKFASGIRKINMEIKPCNLTRKSSHRRTHL